MGAAVLSTISGIPFFRPMSDTSAIGNGTSLGFGNVSPKYALV